MKETNCASEQRDVNPECERLKTLIRTHSRFCWMGVQWSVLADTALAVASDMVLIMDIIDNQWLVIRHHKPDGTYRIVRISDNVAAADINQIFTDYIKNKLK